MTQPSAPDSATSPLTPDTPAGQHRPRLSQALQLDTRYPLWREWRRPWKLFALACGIGLLVIGRYLMPAPDWDIPISFIMGLMAYACASWCLRVFLARDWPMWPLAIFLSWFTIDGCYAWYWSRQLHHRSGRSHASAGPPQAGVGSLGGQRSTRSGERGGK